MRLYVFIKLFECKKTVSLKLMKLQLCIVSVIVSVLQFRNDKHLQRTMP